MIDLLPRLWLLLIDNIIISQKHLENYESCVLIDDTSDHLPCLVKLTNFNASKKNETYVESRDTRKKSLDRLKENLSNVGWENKLKNVLNEDTNEMF